MEIKPIQELQRPPQQDYCQREPEYQRGKLVTEMGPRSGASEAFRILTSNLKFTNLEGSFKCIGVTSAIPAEGKSTIAANLALTLALEGKRVVLVDADLRRPSLHKLFGIRPPLGLTTALVDGTEPHGLCHNFNDMPLKILTAGISPPNSSELLGSNRMKLVLKSLAEKADFVILDCPPTLGLNDTLALSGAVDGFLLVVARGGASRTAIKQTKAQLDRIGAKLIGAVFNRMELNNQGYYYYGN